MRHGKNLRLGIYVALAANLIACSFNQPERESAGAPPVVMDEPAAGRLSLSESPPGGGAAEADEQTGRLRPGRSYYGLFSTERATDPQVIESENAKAIEGVSRRIGALESELTRLREEQERLRPAINQVLRLQNDVDDVLRQIERVIGQGPAAPIEATAFEPAPTTPLAAPGGVVTPARTADRAPEPALGDAPAREALPVLRIGKTEDGAGKDASRPPRAPEPARSGSVAQAGVGVWAHLASFSTEALAEQAWRGMRAKLAGLGDLQHRVRRFVAPGSGQVYYRLLVGAFDSEPAAYAACERLKSRGEYCSVVDG